MTPFQFRCRKALLLLLALVLALLCSLFNPTRAQVSAMVKNQPFPYPTGVAMDTVLYQSVKAKLRAADSLRTSAERRINLLQDEIAQTRKAKDDLFILKRYTAIVADSLTVVSNQLQRQLATAQTALQAANEATGQILATLPRRIRKTLEGEKPDVLAKGVVAYVQQQQTRKWKWLGAGSAISFFIGFLFALK